MILFSLLTILLFIAARLLAPLVTNVGKAAITAALAAGNYKYVAIGTGNTAEAATQTALVTEVETRVSGTQTQQTTTTTNDTYRVVGTVSATGTRAVQESGIFDQLAAGGNMLCRGVFSTINLASGDSIQVTWNIQFT